jgi:hypothetical protein
MLEMSLIYQYVMVANNMASFLLRNVAMERMAKRVVWNSINITNRRRAETDD